VISDEAMKNACLDPTVQVGIAEMFEPFEMITVTLGFTECRECGASLIVSMSRMNYNTCRHYLWHHPERIAR